MGIRAHWEKELLRFEASVLLDAIEIYADKFNMRPPTLDALMEYVDETDKKRRINVDQAASDAVFNAYRAEGATSRDKTLAYHSMALIRALVSGQINSTQAIEYLRTHLVKVDVDNSGEYYTMAKALERGQAEIARGREKVSAWQEKQVDIQAEQAQADSPKSMLDSWLKREKSTLKIVKSDK